MTEHTGPPARYTTLRDYLRVLRRYGILIVVIGIVGCAAGYVSAREQTSVYEASAQLSFRDPTQDLSLVGFGANAVQSPAELATTNSLSVARPAFMQQVSARLGGRASAQQLAGDISTQVDPVTGLLSVIARSANAGFSAHAANAVAEVLVSQSNSQTDAEFAGLAARISRRIANLTSKSGIGRSPASGGQLSFYEDELARIDTVRAVSHSAMLVKPAQQPSTPVSPKPTRGALLGLVLGLLLGIVVAFLRDSLDRRLRSARDIEHSLTYPVVGHIRNKTMGRVAQLPDPTIDDYRIDLEAFRILRRNLEFLDRERASKSVLVTSALPEEGKTTVAASLAFAIASTGRKTLLVDCDLRRPMLAQRLSVERSPGLNEYLEGEASPQHILRTVNFVEPPTIPGSMNGTTNGSPPRQSRHSLVFIPAGSPTGRAAELLGSSRFADFLDQVSAAYDAIVLDSSPLLPVADTLEMISHVDAILLCARESQITRDQAIAAKTALERFPRRPIGVVVTGVKPHTEDYELYSYSYDYS